MEQKRVVFSKGLQRKFIEKCKSDSGLTWDEMAQRIGSNRETLKSFQYERCRMPKAMFYRICSASGLDPGKAAKNYKSMFIDFRYESNFGENFGRRKTRVSTRELHPNSTNVLIINSKGIEVEAEGGCTVIPKELTPALAEEIGIHIGDGHLSANRSRYKLYGNLDESDYYFDFIPNLYRKLYGIEVNIRRRKEDRTIGFEKSSRSLWLFKTKMLLLPCGKKGNIAIPKQIMNSGADVVKSFVRGVFDTDGSIHFQSRYGYEKYYPRLAIDSMSYKLCKGIDSILIELGFKSKVFKNRRSFSTIMYGYENLMKYASEIGWHNKKHEKKFEEWAKRYPELVNGRSGVVSNKQSLLATRSA